MSSQGKQRVATGFEIAFNEASVVSLVEELKDQKHNIPIATADAITRTGRSIKTLIMRAVTQNLNIKRKDIDGNSPKRHRHGGVFLRFSGEGTLKRATIIVTGHRIPVYFFGARPELPPVRKIQPDEPKVKRPFAHRRRPAGIFKNGRPRKGVSWRIYKGAGVTTVKDAFIARMKSGHVGVFKRMQEGRRLPIAKLFGPSIPHVALTDPKLQDDLKVNAPELLSKNISNQIDRFLQRSRVRAQAVTSG
jgi:hypothetical protein